MARHSGKHVQENVFKGPLNDLDLHYPTCSSFVTNYVFYLCALLAQWLLRVVQRMQRSLGTRHSACGKPLIGGADLHFS